MTPQNSTKQKIFALLTVLILFAIVGSILYSISLDNKRKTEILQEKVGQILREKIITDNFNNLHFSTSTLSEVTSRSYLTIAVTDDGRTKILASKYPDLTLPIASMTKLMLAVITLENMSPETPIKATLDYIGQEESVFVLETDKIYTVKELLANALISSDNDSARLLSGALGTDNFVTEMNNKAVELGMTQTKYFNVTGLDPKTPSSEINISTVSDFAKLLIYIKDKHPEIFKLTAKPEYNFCDINNYCKLVLSTNKLLTDPNFKYKIIGGKTGSTDIALKNLSLVIEIIDGIDVINVVMGSADNFADTLSIINNIEN